MARAAHSADEIWMLYVLGAGLESRPTAVRSHLRWEMQRHLDLMEQRRREAKETDDGLYYIHVL